MGDEHVARDPGYLNLDPKLHIVTAHGLSERIAASIDRYLNPVYRYTCTSDQYTDTHVYAHGDAGDRADNVNSP